VRIDIRHLDGSYVTSRGENPVTDPYGQPQPYGQQPASPYGQPYGQPVGGGQHGPYGQPPVSPPYGQPAYGAAAPYGQAGYGVPAANVPDYLAWSIINIFLFFPLAIFAIIKSNEVKNYLTQGNIAAARQSSDTAKTMNLIATLVGGGLTLLGIILAIIFAAAAATYY